MSEGEKCVEALRCKEKGDGDDDDDDDNVGRDATASSDGSPRSSPASRVF